MSERKVLNKYYPPDFDPSKIRRRKGINAGNPQITIRLMAPFSMRCTRCGEYVYKGKKFNARKETAMNEEYYGIKVFRFYIKCPVCSSEITFKTDPKNADYICEHGATRNFENWSEADPSKRVGAMPDAAADDEYDSEGNPLEDKAAEKDAMADLERSQEQSRREMEMMDELADLRQRNARLEQSGVGADPEALLSALHAERQTAEEEARRKVEQEEDDEMVAKYFAKVQAGPPPPGAIKAAISKDKGKGKAVDREALQGPGLGPLVDQGGSDSDEGSGSEDEGGTVLPIAAAITVKRRPAPSTANGSNGAAAEPSVASLLAAKGKALETATATNGSSAPAPAVIKRKREDMQKLLGIKKKK